MIYLKQMLAVALTAFILSAVIAHENDLAFMAAAGAIGAFATAAIFLIILLAVKVARRLNTCDDVDVQVDEHLNKFNGFDAEGNLKIHSWLRHGGK